MSSERRAEEGERCTCGRPAVTVFLTERFGEVGWCGVSDGGDQAGPCPFCGGARHEGRCPQYRLRPDTPAPSEGPVSPQPQGVDVTYLHRDHTPLTLRLLDGLLGHRSDRTELGYRPDQWGAEVDWDQLMGGALSTTEVAAVHIALGCAIAERNGGALPASVRGPLRAVINDLAPGKRHPVPRPGARGGFEPDNLLPPAPGVDL